MRYFMRLAYCGANYHGWQVQPHDVSVQQTIEQALAMLMRRDVAVTGAGRTDTGVNAAMMVAHFDTPEPIDDCGQMVHSLNGILPRDIAVYSISPVDEQAHARFDATSRTYKYFAHTAKSPFLDSHSWRCRPDLDFALMNEAAAHLMRYTDFTSFSKLHTDVATNNCRVTHAQWTQLPGMAQGDGAQWVFTVTADRFLRNMVRAIVGTLTMVGAHKISVADFCRIIESKDRCKAGTSMPGHALYLWEITYPFPIL